MPSESCVPILQRNQMYRYTSTCLHSKSRRIELHFSLVLSSDELVSIMPKEKESLDLFLKSIVKDYPDEFSADNKVLLCKLCGTSVNLPNQKRFHVTQHRGGQKHQRKLQQRASSLANVPSTAQLSQQLISLAVSTQSSSSQYAADLCEALIAGNVLQ